MKCIQVMDLLIGRANAQSRINQGAGVLEFYCWVGL